MEILDFAIHLLHAYFSSFDLFLGLLDILVKLFAVLLLSLRGSRGLVDVHPLGLSSEESAQDVRTVPRSSTAVLHRGDVSNVIEDVLRSIGLEWQVLVNFV